MSREKQFMGGAYIERARDLSYDVRDFHNKFGLLHFLTPQKLTKRKLIERVECLREELGEFIEACGLEDLHLENGTQLQESDREQNLAGQADALVDLVYFALGTVNMLGLPWQPLWDDVQRANMAKVRGVTQRGHKVDVKKPPGWVGPQTDAILIEHGYVTGRPENDDPVEPPQAGLPRESGEAD